MQTYERIRAVRTTLKLSQAKFASRIAMSPSYLADIELGNKTASERVIRLMAVEFNINNHWLRTGEGEMFNDGVDAQVSKLINLFKSLNQPFKDYVLKQIEELACLQNHNTTMNSDNT